MTCVIRFGMMGASATANYATILWTLSETGYLRASEATVCALMVAFPVSYLGQLHFTLCSTRTHQRILPEFAVTATTGSAFNGLTFYIITDILVWSYWGAFVVVSITVFVLVFLLSKHLAFGSEASPVPSPARVPDRMGASHFLGMFKPGGIAKRRVPILLLPLPEQVRFSKGPYGWVGFSHQPISYDVEARGNGAGKRSHLDPVEYASSGIVSLGSAPLRTWCMVGISAAILSRTCGVWKAVTAVHLGRDASGLATFAAALYFVGTSLLTSARVLGEYSTCIFLKPSPDNCTSWNSH